MPDTTTFPLTTERLTLRYVEESDRAALVAYYGRDDVARYLPFEAWTDKTTPGQIAKRVGRRGVSGPGQG